ncbi:MAG: helix-turn-helix domain-containing protein, partial [Erysipelotrichaceae bacterium]|nr:helix-turn-helix domain-containing protein [Erysipelotrichaceae bacterium]
IARRAAETGKSLNLSTLYRYSDVLVYDMLNTLAKTDDLRNYQCAAIDQLKHYDQKYGTSYLQTLQMYLTYCGDVSQIAKLLYTHRNTILHRIQKIEEIISMPLDNHEVRVLLSLNLKIDSLLNTNQ